MNSFLDKLKKNQILTNEDILFLKENIKVDNPNLDNSTKASLLAKSIHSILNERLRGFTKDYKNNIKAYLIKNIFLKNKKSICQYDILKACASSKNTSLEHLYQVTRWLKNQLKEEVALHTVKDIIQNITMDVNGYMEDRISLNRVPGKNDGHNSMDKTPLNQIPHSTNLPIDNKHSCNGDHLLESSKNSKTKDSLYSKKNTFKKAAIKSNTHSEYILKLKNKIEEFICANILSEKNRKYVLSYSLAICLLIPSFTHMIRISFDKDPIEIVSSSEYDESKEGNGEIIIDKEIQLLTSHLPKDFKHRRVNQNALRDYLIKRNSLLAKEPYFSIIINTSMEFNINPILLFSIAGHEQAFVPQDHKYAQRIANNPYNVFQSWINYNTDIEDSSKIACRTIINLLRDRPNREDPFQWMNRKYAEDKNWWKGVKSIYNMLEEKTM